MEEEQTNGGMLISPLLLQVGIAPEISSNCSATCSFMVLFSSTMSAIQYLLLGMEHTGTACLFAILCFVASLVGLMVVQKGNNSVRKGFDHSVLRWYCHGIEYCVDDKLWSP
ncbi:Uncharacterized protein Rs2_27045 [Raphanus sativus]|nr:Uncharacterized protein Rs2_27045 [Raphanus sativus]